MSHRGTMASHLEPTYEGSAQHPLPVTERLTARMQILPLFHDLTEADQDIDTVVSMIAVAPSAPDAIRTPA